MPKEADIGEMLVKKKVITKKQLEEAQKKQRKLGKKLSDIFIDSGVVNEKTYLESLAKQKDLQYVELSQFVLDKNIAHILPENYARHFKAILLEDQKDHYLVGMVDPLDIFATDELRTILKKPLKLALVSEKELTHTINQLYRRADEITSFADDLASELTQPEPQAQATTEALLKIEDPAVLKLLNSIFADALQVGASDVHIEPDEKLLRIRLRVDGILQEQVINLPDNSEIPSALAQRLKLMAGLNIAEKRLPQDGRFETKTRDATVEVRLSSMPNQYGESIVMRLLNKAGKILDLDTTGMPTEMLERFRSIIKSPHGMILVTGPTGSGKTTTLYGALSEINDVAKNIVTIEDPVEYRLPRLNQTQVNPRIGLTFATILRSILRQDPNIILVGEIRDKETASIALRAALTGQLVFATLHTNDAASTALRLVDIGVESYLVASTVRAIVAQRLARRVCPYCTASYTPTAQETTICTSLFGDLMKESKFTYGTGCMHCNSTGFKGRIGVFELLELDNDMRETLRVQDTNAFVKTVAKNRTSHDLLRNAFDLAREGTIPLSEVIRITGEQF